MKNVFVLVSCGLSLLFSSVVFAAPQDTPFTFCGQAKTVVINGKTLSKAEVKRFENCASGHGGGEPTFAVSGYKNRTGKESFNFKTENDVLMITIKDEKGQLIKDW